MDAVEYVQMTTYQNVLLADDNPKHKDGGSSGYVLGILLFWFILYIKTFKDG